MKTRELLSKLGAFDAKYPVSEIQTKVSIDENFYLEEREDLVYCLNGLCISADRVGFRSSEATGLSISIPIKTNLKEVKYLVRLFIMVFGKKVPHELFFNYSTDVKYPSNAIYVGSRIRAFLNFTNVSRALSFQDILRIREDATIAALCNLFPNINFEQSGICVETDRQEQNEEEYYQNHDYRRDTFSALTDGRDDAYDHWKNRGGSLDDVFESSGF